MQAKHGTATSAGPTHYLVFAAILAKFVSTALFRLRQHAKEFDEVVDVVFHRDTQVFAAEIDRLPVHFGREGGVLDLFPDRACLHLPVRDRIQFPVT